MDDYLDVNFGDSLPVSKSQNVFNNPIADYVTQNQIGIEQITVTATLTRIDLVYIAPRYYQNGGWIQINPECYLRPFGTNERYQLVEAHNIPYAPGKYYFKSPGQVHRFSLLFPALPKNVKKLDLIEKLGDATSFNFFRVGLQINTPTLFRTVNEN